MPTPRLAASLSQEAVDAVKKYGTQCAAARALGISRGALQNRIRMAETPLPEPATPKVLDEDGLRDRVFELESLLKTARKDTLTDDWVKRKIIGIERDIAESRTPTWAIDFPRGHGAPGVPNTIWSDWHAGEVVFPSQVNGVNEYNMDIFHARAKRLVERTIYLLRHHVVHPDYPGIVVNLGGDMVSGDLHDELSNSNEMPIMPVLIDLFGVLCWALKALADEFGNVFVPCVTGNHGRNTRKPQAKNRNYTNFDWLLYQFLAKHFVDDERVTFYIPDGSDALYKIYEHRYLLTHGDQFRGGDGIIGAIGPITRGNQRKQSRNSAINRAYDTMLLGHWHQYMPLHRTLVNGSLKGYDEYASVSNFGYEPPIQAMWLTHPEHGVTMHLPIYLEQHAGRKDVASPWISWKDGA